MRVGPPLEAFIKHLQPLASVLITDNALLPLPLQRGRNSEVPGANVSNDVALILAPVATLRPAAPKGLGASVEAQVSAQVGRRQEDLSTGSVGTLLRQGTGGFQLLQRLLVNHLKVMDDQPSAGGSKVAVRIGCTAKDAIQVGAVVVVHQLLEAVTRLVAVLAHPPGQVLVSGLQVNRHLVTGEQGTAAIAIRSQQC